MVASSSRVSVVFESYVVNSAFGGVLQNPFKKAVVAKNFAGNGDFIVLGRLVMIDSRLKPFDLVPKLMFGEGKCTYLVECDGNLYVVDRVGVDDSRDFKLGVFKLDDKGRFWDYELDLNDCVFFVGDDANFSLSRNDYHGDIGNVIYFKGVTLEDDGDRIGGIDEFTKVFEMKTNSSSYLVESESYAKLYWPPSSWFSLAVALNLR
uniref:KIB1-4 beta-propeller domain-containing protein n=1 Tax=Chenopodium quinoa TaxID=63459 RepID=A0A803MKZ7_CHEQI